MLAEERFNRILNIVEEKKSVTVTELTELLDTSESTIRRDLTTLDKRKKLIKVHGGATAVDMEYMTKDSSVSVRQDLNREEKIKIGKYAAGLIIKDDFVYIDAGTSTEYLVEQILEKDKLKEITEKMQVLMLADMPDFADAYISHMALTEFKA